MGLIDSHCHWDASEFNGDAVPLLQEAVALGVTGFLLPAVERSNWTTVSQLSCAVPEVRYCLGIHPLYVKGHNQESLASDLQALRALIPSALNDPRFVGIGEIGLDYFVPDLNRELQWFAFSEQLKLARDFELPVVMHVRRSQDMILKGVRQFGISHGIAHAFNGSDQQADTFVQLGLCLGFGGAMTYTRALQIRRLASSLPLEALVLETDAPDIAPEWINHERNDSRQLPRIAQVLADLRGISFEQVAVATTANVQRVFSPRWDIGPLAHRR
jgi:TatD DNase family protein